MEFTLLGAAVAGVAALWLALRYPSGASDEKGRSTLFDPALAAIGIGLFAGRLWAMLASGTNPITNPGDILIIRGGVSTGAAALAALLAWMWLNRTDLVLHSDAMAAPALAGLAGWHLGCVVRDACAGTATDLPWAITLSGSGVGRHPVEIYAGLALLVAAAAVNRIGLAAGVGAGAALALAAGIRLATEPLRASLTGGPVWWYWAGVAAGVLVVITAQRAARHGGLHSPA